MAFPFLFLVLPLAAGILLSSLVSLSHWILISGLVTSLACAWIFFVLFKKNVLAFILILLTTFFFGSSLYDLSNKDYEENPIRRLKVASYADFYGRLYRSPVHGIDRDLLYMKVEKVAYQNKEEIMSGNLRVSVPHTSDISFLSGLFVNDRIKVSAQLAPLKGYRNFYPSPLEIVQKNQKIHNRAFSKSPLLVERIGSGHKISIFRLISIVRQRMHQKIEEHFSPAENTSVSSQGAILEALLLGERGRMDDSVSRSLQNAGLYHLFAISGAHIALLSFLFFLLLRIIRIPNRLSYLLMMLLLIGYALLVEGRPSVMRATIMALAFLIGKLFWKDVNLINTVSVSAFILLVINPFNLFSAGFQLTFGATLSIILFFPKIIKFLPALPLRISEIFALSLTAQLGVWPLVASSFNRITFSSLMLNLVALPLVGLIMAVGYIFLPLSFISPYLAQLLAKALHFFINLLTDSAHLFDLFPFLSFRIPTPHLLTILAYFLFLFLLLLPSRIKGQRLIFLLCFLVFFAVLVTYPFPSHSKNLKLTFLDVGQGESILIEFPGQKKMLVDGGGLFEGSFDIGESVVSPFLWKKGIKKIDYLVLTHAHPDHMGGLMAVARNFKVGEFWEAFSPAEDKEYTNFKSLLFPKTQCKRIFKNYSLFANDVKIEVLHPKKEDSYLLPADNDQSIVLKVSYIKTSLLLTGDIGSNVENEILGSGYELSSQLLKSPHHGSSSSSSFAFLHKISPQIIVISVGERNRYGFPNQEVIERYKEVGADIYRTDYHGAIEASSSGYEIHMRTASGEKSK